MQPSRHMFSLSQKWEYYYRYTARDSPASTAANIVLAACHRAGTLRDSDWHQGTPPDCPHPWPLLTLQVDGPRWDPPVGHQTRWNFFLWKNRNRFTLNLRDCLVARIMECIMELESDPRSAIACTSFSSSAPILAN